jgi:hypothetical protein
MAGYSPIILTAMTDQKSATDAPDSWPYLLEQAELLGSAEDLVADFTSDAAKSATKTTGGYYRMFC